MLSPNLLPRTMSQHTNLHPNNSTSQPEPAETNERGHPAFRRLIRDARGFFGWTEDVYPPATHATDHQDDSAETHEQPGAERGRRAIHLAPAPYVRRGQSERNIGALRQPLASSSGFDPGAPQGSSFRTRGWTTVSGVEPRSHQTLNPGDTYAVSDSASPAVPPQIAYAPPNYITPLRHTNTQGLQSSLRERYRYDQQAQDDVDANDASMMDTSSDFALALAQQIEECRAATHALSLGLQQGDDANHDHRNGTPGPAIPQDVVVLYEVCDICGTVPEPPYNLRCSHFFCENCLSGHVTSTVRDGIYPVTCPSCDMEGLFPEDGATVLDATFIEDYLAVSQDVWEDFRQLERNAYARLAQYSE